jgi:hypothetical protein
MVGPGLVVTGTVSDTRGWDVVPMRPVVKCHTKGFANATPPLRLVAPVIVPVYRVEAVRLAAEVKVAMVLVASSDTVPMGLTHGAAQVTVKLALPVSGFIGSLKAAVMRVLLVGTPVA